MYKLSKLKCINKKYFFENIINSKVFQLNLIRQLEKIFLIFFSYHKLNKILRKNKYKYIYLIKNYLLLYLTFGRLSLLSSIFAVESITQKYGDCKLNPN